MKYKLVCFDVDGTLIDEITYIWDLMHKSLAIDQGRVARATARFYRGEISFREWAEHDINLWIERGVTREDLIDVVKKLRLMKGAGEVLAELKGRGYRLAVISGGLNIALDYFIPDAEGFFDHVMINRLFFDGEGRITRIEPTEFGADRHKIDGLRKIAKMEGITLEECVFVGDSDNDIEIAKGAGFSIGFNPHERLAQVCDAVVRKKDLREILRFIE